MRVSHSLVHRGRAQFDSSDKHFVNEYFRCIIVFFFVYACACSFMSCSHKSGQASEAKSQKCIANVKKAIAQGANVLKMVIVVMQCVMAGAQAEIVAALQKKGMDTKKVGSITFGRRSFTSSYGF